jgi:nucleotide-binding universal stress UspA family protein
VVVVTHAVVGLAAALLVEGCHRRTLLASIVLLAVSWAVSVAARVRPPVLARHPGGHVRRPA